MAMKKAKRRSTEVGVELRNGHYRFRFRDPYMDKGVRKFLVHSMTFEFRPEAECQAMGLPANHDLWPANALNDANAYSRNYHRDRKPINAKANARPVVHGSLREWLERYRDEGLAGHAFGDPDRPAPFKMDPRAANGLTHDIGQINTLMRMGGFAVAGDEKALLDPRRQALMLKNWPELSLEVQRVLETEIPQLNKSHFKIISDRWSKGQAAPNTKRRLRSTVKSCFTFHADHYQMDASTQWLEAKIANDGRDPKARALTEGEWTTIEGSLDARSLHPSVRGCIEFTRWAGCRRGEACSLRWENITWPGPNQPDAVPVAHFKRTKARRGAFKSRAIPLVPNAVEGLRIAARLEPDDQRWPVEGWVFPQPKPKKGAGAVVGHVSGTTVYTAFVRTFGMKSRGKTPVLAAQGIKPAAVHHLRHTRATELSAGMNELQIMEYFGWDDPAMVKRYRHMAEEMGFLVRDADNKLRGTAQMQSEQDVLAFFQSLPAKDQERLFSKMGGAFAQQKTVNALRRKGAKKACSVGIDPS